MIVIIDYGMGNLASIANMIRKVGGKAQIARGPEDVEQAEKLILPGVGSFDRGMVSLRQHGYEEVLNRRVLTDRVPILGICLGMQMLTLGSEEGEPEPGLGWIKARTIRWRHDPSLKLKIPHMGWNRITVKQPHPLFPDPQAEMRFYFVHSYHVVCEDAANVLTTSNYGFEFTSSIVRENIVGMQFHPEKSLRYGMAVMQQFVKEFNRP